MKPRHTKTKLYKSVDQAHRTVVLSYQTSNRFRSLYVIVVRIVMDFVKGQY